MPCDLSLRWTSNWMNIPSFAVLSDFALLFFSLFTAGSPRFSFHRCCLLLSLPQEPCNKIVTVERKPISPVVVKLIWMAAIWLQERRRVGKSKRRQWWCGSRPPLPPLPASFSWWQQPSLCLMLLCTEAMHWSYAEAAALPLVWLLDSF